MSDKKKSIVERLRRNAEQWGGAQLGGLLREAADYIEGTERPHREDKDERLLLAYEEWVEATD